MTSTAVNVDNFARAETHPTFTAIRQQAGAIARWSHNRAPTPIDHQPVIRQNRDTLYSAAVFDATSGVSFQEPEMGERYASLMLMNEDHYVTHVLHGAGTHSVEAGAVGTPLAMVAPRWGGRPDREARYVSVDPGLPPGEYRLVVRDVPVDGFWSISVYDAAGYFEENARGAYNVNSVTATQEPDGSVVVRFGGDGEGVPNWLPTMEEWNYLVRLYPPRAAILDGSWTFPSVDPVG